GRVLGRYVVLAVLLANVAPASRVANAQAACQLSGGFAQLQAQLPDRVGTCTGAESSRPELGEATQSTTNGVLIYHVVDGLVSFSDGSHTWVMDPSGQVQVRGGNERFPFEFNGDGLPLVGQPAPANNGPDPTASVPVLSVE